MKWKGHSCTPPSPVKLLKTKIHGIFTYPVYKVFGTIFLFPSQQLKKIIPCFELYISTSLFFFSIIICVYFEDFDFVLHFVVDTANKSWIFFLDQRIKIRGSKWQKIEVICVSNYMNAFAKTKNKKIVQNTEHIKQCMFSLYTYMLILLLLFSISCFDIKN